MKAFLLGAALLGLATAAQAQVLAPTAGVPVSPTGAINSATATPAGVPLTPTTTSTVPSAATLPGTASPVTGTVPPLMGSRPVGVGAPATTTRRSTYGTSVRPARTRSTTTRATMPTATPVVRP